jgi:hypothetical protein
MASGKVLAASTSAWNATRPAVTAMEAQLLGFRAADVRAAPATNTTALLFGPKLEPAQLGADAATMVNPHNPLADRFFALGKEDASTDAYLLDMMANRVTPTTVVGVPSSYSPASGAAGCSLRAAAGSPALYFEYGGWNEPWGFVLGSARLVNASSVGPQLLALDVAGNGGYGHVAGARAGAGAACGELGSDGGGPVWLFGGLAPSGGGALVPSQQLFKIDVKQRLQLVGAAAPAPTEGSPAPPGCPSVATLVVEPTSSQAIWVHVVDSKSGKVVYHDEGVYVARTSPYMQTFFLPEGKYTVLTNAAGKAQLLYADGMAASGRGLTSEDRAAEGLVDATGARMAASGSGGVFDFYPCRNGSAQASPGQLVAAQYAATSGLLAPFSSVLPPARHG